MHWLCFHLEFEHDGDPDVACADPSCLWWHIDVFRRRLEELGENPQAVLDNAVMKSDAPPVDAGQTVTLYRPVGPKELALIEASGWKEFPPRLPGQPIFYPVLNEEYATQIARDWNVKASGGGFVTRFQVAAEFVRRYSVQTVGASVHKELWVPAQELGEFNNHIVGPIEVISEFR
jgi:hypothetical protein